MKTILLFPAFVVLTHFCFAQSWNITGNSGTTTSNFLGTTDNKSLVIKTNNTERMRITNNGKVGIGITNPSTTIDLKGTFKAGGTNGYCKIDTTGNFSFNGDGALRIANNKYIFKLANGQQGGGYYSSTNKRFELRDTFAARVFSVALSTGDSYLKGGLQIGNSSSNVAGNIRWSGTNFEGYNGTAWVAFSGGGGGGANTSLSNLTATSINQSLNPSTNNSVDLGTSASGWKNVYATGSIYLDGVRFIDNSGSSNTFIGQSAGSNISNGTENTFTGYQAGMFNNAGYDNSFYGYKSGANTSSGTYNTANGANSLKENIAGSYNTALGAYSLSNNTDGFRNTAVGQASLLNNTSGVQNSAIGDEALSSNTTGSYNSATGASALHTNSSGSYNTADGYQSLHFNTTGQYNTAQGHHALFYNSTAHYNTAVGAYALELNSTGQYNTAQGYNAGRNNSSGSDNSFFGYQSGQNTTSGTSNTSMGANALPQNSMASNNTAVGAYSMYSNLTGENNTALGMGSLNANSTGSYITAVGYHALYSNTSFYNSAVGAFALEQNTTGGYNSAFGEGALYQNTTGSANTATGTSALSYNTTGDYNTANGYLALTANTIGSYNTAMGYLSLTANTFGAENTAIGYSALGGNTGGYFNTACGYYTLAVNSTGIYNTALGTYASPASAFLSNSTALGFNSTTSANNQVRIGDGNVTSIGGFVNWSNVSDARAKKKIQHNVPGLSFINQLHPITYTLDLDAIDAIIQKPKMKNPDGSIHVSTDVEIHSRNQKEQLVYSGFIAQDVERAAKSIGYNFSGVDPAKNVHDLYGLRYAEFVVPLVKAVQELDSINKNLESSVGNLKKENAEMKIQIATLQTSLSEHQSFVDGIVSVRTSNPANETPILGQNIPNPFDNSTLIPFRIPKNCKDASIVISESSTGRIVRVVPVLCGETQLSLEAGSLAAGMYFYSLYVDGNIIDTKKMSLQR